MRKYFTQFIFREDYDPEDKGKRKDIRNLDADIIVDDDEREISFNIKNGKKGFRISAFRKGKKPDNKELDRLYSFISETVLFSENFSLFREPP